MDSKSSQSAKSNDDEALEGHKVDDTNVEKDSMETMTSKSSSHAKFGGNEGMEGHKGDGKIIKQDSMEVIGLGR